MKPRPVTAESVIRGLCIFYFQASCRKLQCWVMTGLGHAFPFPCSAKIFIDLLSIQPSPFPTGQGRTVPSPLLKQPSPSSAILRQAILKSRSKLVPPQKDQWSNLSSYLKGVIVSQHFFKNVMAVLLTNSCFLHSLCALRLPQGALGEVLGRFLAEMHPDSWLIWSVALLQTGVLWLNRICIAVASECPTFETSAELNVKCVSSWQ